MTNAEIAVNAFKAGKWAEAIAAARKTDLQIKADGVVLGVVSPMFGDVLNAILERGQYIKARIESTCSHQGKPSACVVVVKAK